MLTQDLYSLLLAFKQGASGDSNLVTTLDTILSTIQNISASLSADSTCLIPSLKKRYEDILSYEITENSVIYCCFKEKMSPDDVEDDKIALTQDGLLFWDDAAMQVLDWEENW